MKKRKCKGGEDDTRKTGLISLSLETSPSIPRPDGKSSMLQNSPSLHSDVTRNGKANLVRN